MTNEEFNREIDSLIDCLKNETEYYGLCFYLSRDTVFGKFILHELSKLPTYDKYGVICCGGAWRFPIPFNSSSIKWYTPRIEWLKSLKK